MGIPNYPLELYGETPFRLFFCSEAVIPVEISELTWRTTHPKSPKDNEKALQEELDLVDEIRDQASFQELIIKQRVASRYNAKVVPRDFEIEDLVLRRANVGLKNSAQGKLAPNWEGPYRVTLKTGNGAFELETMDHKPILRTWNAAKLRKYYS